MQKKQYATVCDTLVASVQATVASDPVLTEEEARTMVAVYLKRNMGRIVSEIASTDAVLIVAPTPKAKKAKEAAPEAPVASETVTTAPTA